MTLQEILNILGVVVPLVGAVLLYVQSRKNKRDELKDAGDSRLQEGAQEVLKAALGERGIERRVDTLSERLDDEARENRRVERELGALKETLPKEFVRRDDWLIAQTRTERKLDAIGDKITNMAGRWPSRDDS